MGLKLCSCDHIAGQGEGGWMENQAKQANLPRDRWKTDGILNPKVIAFVFGKVVSFGPNLLSFFITSKFLQVAFQLD